MRSLNKPLALIGFFVVFFSAIFCPFLKVPLQANWNLYQVDTALFMITNGLLGLSVLLFFMRKLSAFRISAWVLIAWIILSFILVFFQINNYLGFKLIDGLLSKTLNIKWGWGVLFLGALLILFSVGKNKHKTVEERQ
ncbi:Uncharacterised protein [Sphingobacterium mizutaii]|uniref:Uncharacterized protein n=2 Tax=Sphingobacterium mizutaii TaxID=1010 RepID=A0AAJ5BZA7_9SPHI|nr:hypothetical protein [Sphingobacterium mizutaii]SDL88736.1 hypothetical protein SAMN05192578_1157 [Sphingobacterium mizutaii]SNV42178.1 Uncharacterised protein [Sphingobacterium mizutaii]